MLTPGQLACLTCWRDNPGLYGAALSGACRAALEAIQDTAGPVDPQHQWALNLDPMAPVGPSTWEPSGNRCFSRSTKRHEPA